MRPSVLGCEMVCDQKLRLTVPFSQPLQTTRFPPPFLASPSLPTTSSSATFRSLNHFEELLHLSPRHHQLGWRKLSLPSFLHYAEHHFYTSGELALA